jgi:tungstate transport system ATP-binding protein
MPPLYSLERIRQVYQRRLVLEVEEMGISGEAITGIYGPNGSGKSTLLRILALIEAPESGVVRFKGVPARPSDLSLRRRVTLLSQSPYLLKRSVLKNVGYGLKIRGARGRRRKSRRALEMVGLDPEEFGGRMWHELSGGEAQRVALAARLALEPEVLLLDEPTAYLDEESSEKIRSAALFARKEWGAALVLVSHDHDWLRSVCTKIWYMRKGRLAAETF